jgi:hypothetical protein
MISLGRLLAGRVPGTGATGPQEKLDLVVERSGQPNLPTTNN